MQPLNNDSKLHAISSFKYYAEYTNAVTSKLHTILNTYAISINHPLKGEKSVLILMFLFVYFTNENHVSKLHSTRNMSMTNRN